MSSTFGSSPDGKTIYNPAHYVEVADETYTDPAVSSIGPRERTVRPPIGTPVLVQDAVTGLDLPPTATIEFGYFPYTLTDDNRSIRVSADNGVTWAGPFFSIEADVALHNGTLGGGGTVKSINTVAPDLSGDVTLTAADVQARSSLVPVPAASVSGLAGVATSGSYADLSNTPAVRDVDQNADGTWPLRPATTRRCTFNSQPGNTTLPATSGSTSGGVGMVPNFDLYVQWPA